MVFDVLGGHDLVVETVVQPDRNIGQWRPIAGEFVLGNIPALTAPEWHRQKNQSPERALGCVDAGVQ